MSAIPGNMKTGEAGASGWGPQDETMGLARRFLIVFLFHAVEINMNFLPVWKFYMNGSMYNHTDSLVCDYFSSALFFEIQLCCWE